MTPPPGLGRRPFLAALAAAVLPRFRAAPDFRIGWLHDGAELPAAVEFGLGEARHAARLLGGQVALVVDPPNRMRPDVAGWLATLSAPALKPAARIAERSGSVVLNLAERDPELRRQCVSALFHVEAGADQYARAIEAGRCTEPLLWHGRLVRYGAAQLNDRFRHHTGQGMNGLDWAIWFGIKLLWESALRAGSRSGTVAGHLRSGRAGFDGHKGQPLEFDPATGQLIQPLFCPDSPIPLESSLPGGAASCS